MITLDVSVVIAHLQPRDTHHRKATAYLREHAGEPLLIHSLTLAEVLIGSVRAGREQELLDDLRASAFGLPTDVTASRCVWPLCVWRPG